MIQKIKNWFKYNLSFLLILNSPFKFPRIKFYFGNIEKGVPYFLPRKHTKNGYKDKKFGFNWCTLGWKTKWNSIRHEYNPMLSFVAFGKQIHIDIYGSKHCYSYWEAWLYYHSTRKMKEVPQTKYCRLMKTLDLYSNTWIHYDKGIKIEENRYKNILKKKYLKDLDTFCVIINNTSY